MRFGPYDSTTSAMEAMSVISHMKKDLTNETLTSSSDMDLVEENGMFYLIYNTFEQQYKNKPVDAVKDLLLNWLIHTEHASLATYASEHLYDLIDENWYDVFRPFCELLHKNTALTVDLHDKMPTSRIGIHLLFLHKSLPLVRQSNH